MNQITVKVVEDGTNILAQLYVDGALVAQGTEIHCWADTAGVPSGVNASIDGITKINYKKVIA